MEPRRSTRESKKRIIVPVQDLVDEAESNDDNEYDENKKNTKKTPKKIKKRKTYVQNAPQAAPAPDVDGGDGDDDGTMPAPVASVPADEPVVGFGVPDHPTWMESLEDKTQV